MHCFSVRPFSNYFNVKVSNMSAGEIFRQKQVEEGGKNYIIKNIPQLTRANKWVHLKSNLHGNV